MKNHSPPMGEWIFIMNILIVGGHGFIGNYVKQRFYKENWKVTVLDKNKASEKNGSTYHSYLLSSLDKRCDAVFKSGNFDVVLYLEAIDTNEETHYIDDFIHIIHLCLQYNVRKLLFLSSVRLYEDEKDTASVLSNLMEEYCQGIMKNTACRYMGFRIGEVYGPNGHIYKHPSWITSFIQKILLQEDVVIRRGRLHQALYVEDLVDAIYKSAHTEVEGFVDLTGGSMIAEEEILTLLQDKSIKYLFQTEEEKLVPIAPLDNQLAFELLNWKPKYSIEQGISKTYEWYIENRQIEDKVVATNKRIKKEARFLPYIENLLFFAIVFAVNYSIKDNLRWQTIFPLDLSIIYIFVMSIAYGMRQGILSAILSGISYIYIYLSINQELSVILYNQSHIIHLLLYLIVAIMASYFMDNKKREIVQLEEDVKLAQNEIEFITNLYEDTVLVKDQLHEQILNSEDSLGKIYSLSKELNSLLVEDIFVGAVHIVEKLMKTTGVSLYKVSKEEQYLRLLAKSKNIEKEIVNSICIKDMPYLKDLMNKKEIIINRKLEKDMPIMAAPIVYEAKVIAILLLDEMPFENLTLYYENFFKVAIGLIGTALGHALRYEEAIMKEKYIVGTKVMKTKFLESIVMNKEKAKEAFGVNYTILEVQEVFEEGDKALLSRIEKCIRDTDYIGVDTKGKLCMILSNTSYEGSEYVIQRLLNNGVQVTLSDRV